jgi:hypothetical protein
VLGKPQSPGEEGGRYGEKSALDKSPAGSKIWVQSIKEKMV